MKLDLINRCCVFYGFMNLKANNFSTQITVEFEDVDSYRIVHHTKLIAYLERARVRFFSSMGFDLSASNMVLVLYHLETQFKKPAFFQDELSVAVFVKSFDSFRLVLAYKIFRQKDLIAKATTGLCFVDPATLVMVPAPGPYVDKLKQALVSV